ncbi:hypothetical protein, partial [Rhizobium ruizarguesonis]|uniref:hypothetical protein n=1 Tax=Rhizobium ruizarguesonis TaxID=2081791 RepID=UPI0013BC7A81
MFSLETEEQRQTGGTMGGTIYTGTTVSNGPITGNGTSYDGSSGTDYWKDEVPFTPNQASMKIEWWDSDGMLIFRQTLPNSTYITTMYEDGRLWLETTETPTE